MGMFDDIGIHKKWLKKFPQLLELVDGDYLWFQTKDLYSTLDRYIVDKDGKLKKKYIKEEEIPEVEWTPEQRKDYELMKNGIFGDYAPSPRRIVEEKWLDQIHHGIIRVHNSWSLSENKYRWIECAIKFTDGKYSSLAVIKDCVEEKPPLYIPTKKERLLFNLKRFKETRLLMVLFFLNIIVNVIWFNFPAICGWACALMAEGHKQNYWRTFFPRIKIHWKRFLHSIKLKIRKTK